MLTMDTYSNASDPKTVSKNITTISSYSVVLKDDCSERNPVVILSERPAGNYAYISDFGRYYYIVDKTFKGGVWEVTLRCDVLMTFADEIRALDAIIARQENLGNLYLKDDMMANQQNTFITNKKFAGGVSDFHDNERRFIFIAQ